MKRVLLMFTSSPSEIFYNSLVSAVYLYVHDLYKTLAEEKKTFELRLDH